MKPKDSLLVIGIMTGNSLDGADFVLTRFDTDHHFKDLFAHSIPYPEDLMEDLRSLRVAVDTYEGNMGALVASEEGPSFDQIHAAYINFIARGVKELIEKAKEVTSLAEYNLDVIDCIGFHGQTCAHFPPSIARSSEKSNVYTVQIGDGQQLADLTGISVVYDFRSDDLFNGGEAAPFAPVHHQHLARVLQQQGIASVIFCNAGNTGNLSFVIQGSDSEKGRVFGWDTGPFNHYSDILMQKERGERCDRDGEVASAGTISLPLLRLLFEKAAITNTGENFLLSKPPKSSDPQWYNFLPELPGEAPVGGGVLAFEDRLRTASYFSVYAFVHSLQFISEHMQMPDHFLLCGGGWKNPVCLKHFQSLLRGDMSVSPVLPEHMKIFENIVGRISQDRLRVAFSEDFGFDGTVMEARIFADAAVCRIRGIPFSCPEITGVQQETIAGIIRFPEQKEEKATPVLRTWLEKFQSQNLTVDIPETYDSRWSRASAGWYKSVQCKK